MFQDPIQPASFRPLGTLLRSTCSPDHLPPWPRNRFRQTPAATHFLHKPARTQTLPSLRSSLSMLLYLSLRFQCTLVMRIAPHNFRLPSPHETSANLVSSFSVRRSFPHRRVNSGPDVSRRYPCWPASSCNSGCVAIRGSVRNMRASVAKAQTALGDRLSPQRRLLDIGNHEQAPYIGVFMRDVLG